jgi:hypothetical protein
LPHQVGDFVGHLADQRRTDFGVVDLLQVPLDLARRQAARVQRQDLPVQLRPPPLALFHQLRLELAVAVARRFDLQLAERPLKRLFRRPVPAVAAVGTGWIVLAVAQVRRQFPAQSPLHHSLGQLRQHPLHILHRPGVPHQAVQSLVALPCVLLLLPHAVLLYSPGERLHSFLYTLDGKLLQSPSGPPYLAFLPCPAGYPECGPAAANSGNSRNGTTTKTVKR